MNEIDLIAAEHELEMDAIEHSKRRYKEALEKRGLALAAPGQRLVRDNIKAVIAGIEEWQESVFNGKATKGASAARFIAQFDAERLAFTALRQVVHAIGEDDFTLTKAAYAVVRELEAIDLTESLRKHSEIDYQRFCKASARADGGNSRRIAMLRRRGELVGAWDNRKAGFNWDKTVQLEVGVRLIELVVENTGIASIETVHEPAGPQRIYRSRVVISATPVAAEWIDAAHEVAAIRRPVRYPMVVPPRPWTTLTDGGYLANNLVAYRASLVKPNDRMIRAESEDVTMPEVLRAINLLQTSEWAVNKAVLAVVQQTLASPDSITGVPNDREAVTEPERPAFLDSLEEGQEMTPEQKMEFRLWKQKSSECKRLLNKQMSLRGNAMACKEIAEKVADFPAIYFPHTLDWRGRAYPIPAYLNPQGSDLAKGLLRFAKAVPLGTFGQQWLAIHGANSYGVDKVDFADRVKWVGEHIREIIAVADDPLNTSDFWGKADAPFQFLAFCIEWTALCQWIADGNEPQDFASTLPVTIDGSCNGLQHFSAMLRDPIGGAATNLLPSDKPSDIYGIVATKVRGKVELDLTSDDEETLEAATFWNEVGVDRKWAKRNTMTLPYGVTQRGMIRQLWDKINEDGIYTVFGDTEVRRGMVVNYLAEANWDAISSTVIAAREAMDWLREVSGALAKKGYPMIWHTPDGLPVHQRYNKKEVVRIRLFHSKYNLDVREATDKLDSRKQAAGSAPNFVHSIDAAHLRETVRRMADLGITDMMTVHDSFGTHAGNMESLERVTREAFVDLHKGDVLVKLRDELLARLPEDERDIIPPLPQPGDLDLEAVKASPYFFA